MELKGKQIFIVIFDGTYDAGVAPFENYNDALKYANDKLDEFEKEVDCDEEYLNRQILQQEDVKNNNPISKTPFKSTIFADNSEGDYVEVKIIKENIN